MVSFYSLLLLTGILFLPGLIVVIYTGIRKNWFLISISLSYACHVFIYILYNIFAIPYSTLPWTAASIVTISTVALVIKRSIIVDHIMKNTSIHFIILSILIAIYLLIAGAYIEIPADIYRHLEYYQQAKEKIQLGKRYSSDFSIFLSQGSVWYELLAIINYFTKSSTSKYIESIAFITGMLFICSVYYFTLIIFKDSVHKNTIAFLAALLTLMHMGINIFSYVRYYALAPGIINFIIYFTCILLFINLIELIRTQTRFIPDYKQIWMYIGYFILVMTALQIHTQEALFIVVVCYLISIMSIFRNKSSFQGKVTLYGLISIASLFLLMGYFYVRYNFDVNTKTNILWHLGKNLYMIPEFVILNLSYQFIQVITLWGCIVYMLFFIHIKRYANRLFLLSTMVSPVFTIMNPFFVDLFIRASHPVNLWRLSYLIPIHIIAADLLVLYTQKFFTKKNILFKYFSLFIISSLVILLFPFMNFLPGTHYSRFYTLKSVPSEVSYKLYTDLLDFLDNFDSKQQIITDPVTGYFVSAITIHNSTRAKFHPIGGFKRFTFMSYDEMPLKIYSGHLLIVNLRQQQHSKTGRLARHWHENQLINIKNYYPPQLLDHLKNNPQHFTLLWSTNNISVYKIE